VLVDSTMMGLLSHKTGRGVAVVEQQFRADVAELIESSLQNARQEQHSRLLEQHVCNALILYFDGKDVCPPIRHNK
jgi:hypothetical protein